MKTRCFLAAAALALPAASPAVSETPLERGAYLVQTIAACGNCHTPIGEAGFEADKELAGRMVIEFPEFTAFAPNITPAGRVAGWSDDELKRAIREGLRPDGSLIGPPMPIPLYRDLSDSDLDAIVAYVRSLPAVANEVPPSEYRIPLPPDYGPPVGSVPEVPRGVTVEYGAYLAGPVAHCIECHTPMGPEGHPDFEHRLAAGGFEFPGPWGVSVSANLTPHEDGIARWTDDELIHMITTGTRPDGSPMAPPMGFSFYAGIHEDDLRAIILYLRSLPPLPSGQ